MPFILEFVDQPAQAVAGVERIHDLLATMLLHAYRTRGSGAA
jgi:hypothetical protein